MKIHIQTLASATVAVAAVGFAVFGVYGPQRLSAAPTVSAAPALTQTNTVASPTNSMKLKAGKGVAPARVKVRHQLTGAELYSMNCNRCHAERYPTERTAANWKTIMLHMQVRANLPVSQARLILKYLQDNSGR